MTIKLSDSICVWCSDAPVDTEYARNVGTARCVRLSVCNACCLLLVNMEQESRASVEGKAARKREEARDARALRRAQEDPSSCNAPSCSTCGGYGCSACADSGCTNRCASCRVHTWRKGKAIVDDARRIAASREGKKETEAA